MLSRLWGKCVGLNLAPSFLEVSLGKVSDVLSMCIYKMGITRLLGRLSKLMRVKHLSKQETFNIY